MWMVGDADLTEMYACFKPKQEITHWYFVQKGDKDFSGKAIKSIQARVIFPTNRTGEM